MTNRYALVVCLAASAISSAAERNQLVYRYPSPAGVKAFWVCPDVPQGATPSAAGAPWAGCVIYNKASDFFRAGDAMQVWVLGYPMLSRFQVEVQNEILYAPSLPF